MTNYELEREERQAEREMKGLAKVEKERELRKEFAKTLENDILKQMVLNTIDDTPYLFELPDKKANANLKYHENWRNDIMKGDK